MKGYEKSKFRLIFRRTVDLFWLFVRGTVDLFGLFFRGMVDFFGLIFRLTIDLYGLIFFRGTVDFTKTTVKLQHIHN